MRLSTDEWQGELGVGHTETDFHERLQGALYRHALSLLRRRVGVILEDGLWMAEERSGKFADARSCAARIDLHVFDVDHDTLWTRLRCRNEQAGLADYLTTETELRRAWSPFQPPSAQELRQVDAYTVHTGGRGQDRRTPAEQR